MLDDFVFQLVYLTWLAAQVRAAGPHCDRAGEIYPSDRAFSMSAFEGTFLVGAWPLIWVTHETGSPDRIRRGHPSRWLVNVVLAWMYVTVQAKPGRRRHRLQVLALRGQLYGYRLTLGSASNPS